MSLSKQEKRRLMFAFIEFLSREAESTDYSDDSKESIEVRES